VDIRAGDLPTAADVERHLRESHGYGSMPGDFRMPPHPGVHHVREHYSLLLHIPHDHTWERKNKLGEWEPR